MKVVDRKSLKSSSNDAGRKIPGAQSDFGYPLDGGGRGGTKSLVGRGVPAPPRGKP